MISTKKYAAALAAALMVTTAGFSAQAADLQVGVDGVATGAEVAASLEGQNANLHDVTVSSIQTNNGAQLNGGANIHNGANVYVKPGDENALTVNGGGFVVNRITEAEDGSLVPGETVYKVDENGNITGNSAEIKGGATINGGATVDGKVTVNTDDMTVNAGSNHVYVTENGIQLNNGANSLYVNETGTKVEGGLTVENGATINGGLTADGATITGDVNVGGMITSENGADITGTTNLHGDAYVDGTMTADKIVTNSGATINGGATVSGGINADELHVSNGNVSLDAGNNYIQSAVGGNSVSINQDGVSINSGAVNVNQDGMTVNTGATFNGGLNTNEINTATGDSLNINAKETYVNGNETVSGKLTVNSGATINGGATVYGGLTVDGVNVVQGIQQNSNAISSLSSRVDDLGGEIDNVGAISSALAGLHPLDYDGTGSKFQLAAAMGSYDGSQAAAIGGFYHFNEDVMMSVGGATAFDGDNKSAFNVGVSFRIGQGSSGKKVNSDDVLAQLNAMNEKIAALEAENQQLSEKVAALEGGEGAEAAEAE